MFEVRAFITCALFILFITSAKWVVGGAATGILIHALTAIAVSVWVLGFWWISGWLYKRLPESIRWEDNDNG